jgi:YebC/PmpR family DNA-binding regulatory protein
MAGHSAWKNIKHRKAAVDAKRGKIWSKCSRAIIVAAKAGGGDPKFNAVLRLAIDEAKAANMPRDTIEKAVKKGAGGDGSESYEPVRYEGYGPGGVAIIVECLVANVNKTAPEIRTIFDKYGGNLGVPGSVMYSFQHKGVALVPASATTEERLFDVVLAAGAEDVAGGEEGWQVTCAPADLAKVRDALDAAGIAVENAEVSYVPGTMAELDEATAARCAKLLAMLEEHDDVQKVHVNAEIPDA